MSSNNIYVNITPYIILLLIPVLVLDLLYIFLVKERYKRYLIILIALEVLVLHRIICPTYWKYPDLLIDDENVGYWDVEELYGEFDEESNEPPFYKAYYIYTDKNEKKHYYVLWLYTEGHVAAVSDEIIDNGVIVPE